MSNTIHIIHLHGTLHSQGRYDSFTKEMKSQGIVDYKICPGIHDVNCVRGINRAHKKVVQYAKANQLPEICIAEDDIIFVNQGAFEYFLQNKPIEYSLYLGGLSNILNKENDYITDFRGMTLYFIHERFYDTFLAVPDNVNIDSAMKGLGKYYLCPKIICSQRAGYSYHKKRHTDYNHLLKQYEIYGSD